jgi:hypothetical protein
MLRLFLVLLLYGALSLVSMTIVWAMIARKGFAGLESSDSRLAYFFRRFGKARASFVGPKFLDKNPTEAGVGLSNFDTPTVIQFELPTLIEHTSAGSTGNPFSTSTARSYAHGA